MSSRPKLERTPESRPTNQSIIPLVSGWSTSKRESSPSVTTSMPQSSWVLRTTSRASRRAEAVGEAPSQAGTGYEPTTVVRSEVMRESCQIPRCHAPIDGA